MISPTNNNVDRLVITQIAAKYHLDLPNNYDRMETVRLVETVRERLIQMRDSLKKHHHSKEAAQLQGEIDRLNQLAPQNSTKGTFAVGTAVSMVRKGGTIVKPTKQMPKADPKAVEAASGMAARMFGVQAPKVSETQFQAFINHYNQIAVKEGLPRIPEETKANSGAISDYFQTILRSLEEHRRTEVVRVLEDMGAIDAHGLDIPNALK